VASAGGCFSHRSIDFDQSPALLSRQSLISRNRSDSCGMRTRLFLLCLVIIAAIKGMIIIAGARTQ
jgi:hypothetical protein